MANCLWCHLFPQDPNSTPTFFNAVLQVARTSRITATILKGSFDMKTDEDEDDAKFVYFSSSDISTDEESLVPIKKRRRPRFTKKKANNKGANKLAWIKRSSLLNKEKIIIVLSQIKIEMIEASYNAPPKN